MIPVARLAAVALGIVLALPASPAAAAPLQALPATVRVNVAGLGVVSARIHSSRTLRVIGSDGAELYKGNATVVARRDVFRPAGTAAPAPAPRGRAERIQHRQMVLGGIVDHRPLVAAVDVVPFELAVIESPIEDPIGKPLMRADRILGGIRYVAEGGLLTFNGRVFRGTLEIHPDSAGDMIVVNETPTREYIASVVGSEIPLTWHPEAQAAQAIAARTYLMTHLRPGLYHIEGDVRDQAYDGVGKETEATLRAVDRTKGIVVTYNGRPIEALYSANAGGVTEDSENVWGNRIAYLRSVESPWDDAADNSSWGQTSWEWKRELTAPQLSAFLRQRAFNVGDVTSIELTRVAASGRVLQARVVGSRGSRLIGPDSSRYYFGLRSSLFTVERLPGGDEEVVHYLDAARMRTLAELGAERVGTGYRVLRGSENKIVGLYENSYVYRLPERFVFSGKGFGHGIGMSQWGMQGMARTGASAEQILKHYYKGVDLTDVGGA
jgi:stage II sporulation protein D